MIMFLVGAPFLASSQRFLSDYDSTLFIRDTVVNTVRRFENLHFSGYLQPQFQVAQKEGIRSFEGGNFSQHAANRFMLRRARVKLDYLLPSKNGAVPAALFTFQFEATERDVNVRDVFVRVFEPKAQKLALTAGLFARPFGYEVNYSSSYRETPERGRMSQTLMPSERDLGAMVSYDAKKPLLKKLKLRLDAGLFNGQGKSGPAEFDSYKDLISRLTVKPFSLSRTVSLSGGLSFLNGGWRQATRYRYKTTTEGNKTVFRIDSSLENIGAKALRRYHGADAQVVLKHGWGKTEWRAEYWWGTQPGTATTTVNPGEQPEGPTYIRPFNGAFFYYLQNVFNPDWELMVKYDWYDPNRLASADDISAAGSGLTTADVRYDTWGMGITRYFSEHLKVLAYYSIVANEITTLPGYGTDLPDNVFTLRLQMRF
ncbi:MAG: porin [Bacteroidota bacterium]|nr:porin [Bacteroidota bacterium]